MDHLTPEKRSDAMSRVHSRDTTPEMKVRRTVHAMGYRYRLRRTDLPGKPDLVFPRLRKAVFVHGCFWHFHECKRLPKSNRSYWRDKFQENKRRDSRVQAELREIGWEPFVVWECWTKNPEDLTKRLIAFLES